MAGQCLRRLLPVLLSLFTSIVLAWLLLFHPQLLGCQIEGEPLLQQNQELSLQLQQAKEELQELTSQLSNAQSEMGKASERIEVLKELLPLETNGSCGAPTSLQDLGGFVYCADKPLLVGRARDLATCQVACGFNSSCEFYSYWTSGRRSRLCRITETCEKHVSVKERHETVQIYRRLVAASSVRSYLQLLGMYDSGTNLMLATLASNFPLCCQQARRTDILALQIAGRSHGRCLHFATPEKHVNPLHMVDAAAGKANGYWNKELWDFQNRKQIVIVALVRDPLGQLQSWKKAPYGLERCTTSKRCTLRSSEDCAQITSWLVEPCSFYDVQILPGTGVAGGSFRNLPAVWNAYSLGYLRLQLESGYKQIFLMKFEDLVLAPEESIKRISEALRMPVTPEEVVKADRAAKAHGRAKNRSHELRSLEMRDFMKRYSQRELRAACIRLNFSLAEVLAYPLLECADYKDQALNEEPVLSPGVKSSPTVDPRIAERVERFRRHRPTRAPPNRTRPRRPRRANGTKVLRPKRGSR